MKRWYGNWDAASQIYKFSSAVRKVIHTANAIESLNSTLPKADPPEKLFPRATALLKALYLAIFEAIKMDRHDSKLGIGLW